MNKTRINPILNLRINLRINLTINPIKSMTLNRIISKLSNTKNFIIQMERESRPSYYHDPIEKSMVRLMRGTFISMTFAYTCSVLHLGRHYIQINSNPSSV